MSYKNIKDLRKNYNLTQSQISNMLGVSERNYRAKENGELPFTQLELMKLIKLFNLQKDESFELFYWNAFNTKFWKNDFIRFIK